MLPDHGRVPWMIYIMQNTYHPTGRGRDIGRDIGASVVVRFYQSMSVIIVMPASVSVCVMDVIARVTVFIIMSVSLYVLLCLY